MIIVLYNIDPPTKEKIMAGRSAQEIAEDIDVKLNPSPGFWVKIRSWAAKLSAGKISIVVEEETLTVEKDFILRVLPHRGRMLLLDRVMITPNKVTGFFTVTKEVCAGHAIGDVAVFRGVELPEMANQLLGIWYATQHPELIGAGKVLFARTGDYKASGFIQPGDLVRIEADYADLSGSVVTNRRGTFMSLTGKNFTVKVGNKLRGSVSLIELKGLEGPQIALKT